MVHKEANGVNGGALNPAAVADKFYVRKLNVQLANQVESQLVFDGTAYSFTLPPGTYRIDASFTINTNSASADIGYCVGLYNLTTATFEVYTGGTEAILAATGYTKKNASVCNETIYLRGQFTVSSSNKTYQIMHKCSDIGAAQSIWFCGFNDQMTGANVNGAVASQFYAFVKIGRET